jgi:DNA-binding NarL/FixJ family response regulator
MINVILADHQRIFRIGMASALAAEDDIRIVSQPQSVNQLLNALENFRAHVVVLSSAFLCKLEEIEETAARQQTAILLIEEAGSAMLAQTSPEIRGVMQRSADELTIVRSVRHLARGGKVLCLARHHLADFERGSVGLRVCQRLSHLELKITALVVQGYRNREIARKLGTTEQGIKNSLRKIFDKTGVFDRLQLALFVLHHRTLARAAENAHPAPAMESLATMQLIRDLRQVPFVN